MKSGGEEGKGEQMVQAIAEGCFHGTVGRCPTLDVRHYSAVRDREVTVLGHIPVQRHREGVREHDRSEPIGAAIKGRSLAEELGLARLKGGLP